MTCAVMAVVCSQADGMPTKGGWKAFDGHSEHDQTSGGRSDARFDATVRQIAEFFFTTPGRSFRCPGCCRTFTSASGLGRHVQAGDCRYVAPHIPATAKKNVERKFKDKMGYLILIDGLRAMGCWNAATMVSQAEGIPLSTISDLLTNKNQYDLNK